MVDGARWRSKGLTSYATAPWILVRRYSLDNELVVPSGPPPDVKHNRGGMYGIFTVSVHRNHFILGSVSLHDVGCLNSHPSCPPPPASPVYFRVLCRPVRTLTWAWRLCGVATL